MIKIEKRVKDILNEHGITVLKEGTPDFLCVKDGKLCFIEVKSRRDKLSKEQKAYHKVLKEHGLKVYVVYESALLESLDLPMMGFGEEPLTERAKKLFTDLEKDQEKLRKKVEKELSH